MALDRVSGRVRMGGHHIPEKDIHRRYLRSIWNFENVYRRMVTAWRLYHGARGFGGQGGNVIAEGEEGQVTSIHDPDAWTELQAQAPGGGEA
jgi:predicted ABC-type ATPase